MHGCHEDDTAENEQILEDVPSIQRAGSSSSLTTTTCATDSDDCMLSYPVGERHTSFDKIIGHPLIVRNTFIDVDDDEDMTTPFRQRAQTWHGTRGTLSPCAIGDDIKPLWPSDCESSVDDEEGTTLAPFTPEVTEECWTDGEEGTPCGSVFFGWASCTPMGVQESCEQEFSILANRVQAPPPLNMTYCSSSSFCLSPPGTVNTSTSSTDTTCQLDVETPSMFARNGATSSGIMPYYSFAYPPVACTTLPNAGLVGGLAHDQTPAHNAFAASRTGEFEAEPHQELKVGSRLLPSVGSAGHDKGLCKPCAFGGERCRNKQSCEFCHICKPIVKSKKGRYILKRRKNAEEIQADIRNLERASCGNRGNKRAGVKNC
jgi:hypothetical protein